MADEPRFEASSSWYGDGFMNLSGGVSQKGAAMGLVDTELALHSGGRAGIWSHMTAEVHGFFVHGQRLTRDVVGDFNTVSNIEAERTLRLFRAFVEKRALGERLLVRAGVLSSDSSFMVEPAEVFFINGLFGPIPTLTGNIPASQYPIGALGLLVEVIPVEDWLIHVAAMDGDAGNDIDNRHGLDLDVSGDQGAALFFEVSRLTSPAEDGYASHVALGGTYSTGTFVDFSTGEQVRGLGLVHVMLEKTLPPPWRGDALDVFVRFGLSPQFDRSAVAWHVDTGFRLAAWLPGQGTLGVGFAWTQFGDAATRAAVAEGLPDNSAEAVLEVTASWQPEEFLTLQPDIQVIMPPQGAGQSAWVLGLRIVLSGRVEERL